MQCSVPSRPANHCYSLLATGCLLLWPATSCLLLAATCCTAACYPLPATYCLLLAAGCCKPPAASCCFLLLLLMPAAAACAAACRRRRRRRRPALPFFPFRLRNPNFCPRAATRRGQAGRLRPSPGESPCLRRRRYSKTRCWKQRRKQDQSSCPQAQNRPETARHCCGATTTAQTDEDEARRRRPHPDWPCDDARADHDLPLALRRCKGRP